ncbi:hypothetical protein NL676_036702 [Syzygium grande]|nr:hypothetical protein NL676_036702 [Syzygium grande]
MPSLQGANLVSSLVLIGSNHLGHGACEFFRWADSPTENAASIDVATSVIAPPEVMNIESAMADAGEDYEVDPLSMMDSDTLDMLFGRVVIRWCWRLAFPPRPSLVNPSPMPSLCGIFPSLAVDHMDISSVGQKSSGIWDGLLKPLVFHRQQLLGRAWEARDCLDCLDFLPVDSSQFKEQVKEFLLCASRLAEIERPTNETEMPNILEHCSRAKKRFHDVSEKYSVTSDAYAAGDGRIKHLGMITIVQRRHCSGSRQSCMSVRWNMRSSRTACQDNSRDGGGQERYGGSFLGSFPGGVM